MDDLTPAERNLIRQAIDHYADALKGLADDMDDDGDDSAPVWKQLRQLQSAKSKI